MFTPTTANAQAVDFMRSVQGHVWNLMAMEPEEQTYTTKEGRPRRFNKTEGIMCHPSDPDRAVSWIVERNGKQNIYFHLGRLGMVPKRGGKACKEDVEALQMIMCDMDYKDIRPGLDWTSPEHIAAAHAECMRRLESYPLRPNCLIFSGGGIQALWFLTEPHVLRGKADIEYFESRARRLADVLGGDPAATTVANLVRLPGTVNVLGTRKRANCPGRKPQLATSLFFDASYLHRLDQFEAAAPKAETPFNFAPMLGGRGYEELFAIIPQAVRSHIAFEGADRSAHCFSAEMKLFKLGLTPAEVVTVLERSACARKYVEAGQLAAEVDRASQKYAARETQKKLNAEIGNCDVRGARTAEIFTSEQMIERFVFVADGQYVARLDTPKLLNWSDMKAVFSASKSTATEAGSTRKIPAIDMWRADSRRKTVDVATWAPGRPMFCKAPTRTTAGDDAVNLWRGFVPLSAPTDWEQWAALFDNHVAFLIPDERDRRRFIQWLAHIAQCPGELPHTAYVFVTPTHGIGRNTLSSMLCRTFQGYVAGAVDLKTILEKDFNGAISQKVLCIVDEAHEGMEGGKRYENAKTLRRIITEEHRHINPKYGAQHWEINCARWLMFSNYDDCVPFDGNDRRLWFIECPTKPRDDAYYQHLRKFMDHPQLAASIMRRLMTVDLSDFNPGEHAPMNAQKMASLDAVTNDVDQAAAEFVARWPGAYATNNQVKRFIENETGGTMLPANHMRKVMQRAGMRSTTLRVLINTVRERVSVVRDLTPEQVSSMDTMLAVRNLTYWDAQFFAPTSIVTRSFR